VIIVKGEEVKWCTGPATQGAEMLVRKPVIADGEWAWMTVRKGVRW
jgi:hypothetical protein